MQEMYKGWMEKLRCMTCKRKFVFSAEQSDAQQAAEMLQAIMGACGKEAPQDETNTIARRCSRSATQLHQRSKAQRRHPVRWNRVGHLWTTQTDVAGRDKLGRAPTFPTRARPLLSAEIER